MAHIERNEMLKCFSPTDDDTPHDTKSPASDKKLQLPPDAKIIHIPDDDSVPDDDDDDAEASDTEDMSIDDENETDKFVQETIDNSQSKKTFKFRFTYETTDKDIFLLCHRRAKRIAIQAAINIDEPLPPNFIQEATTNDFHQFLINERNQMIYQHEYDTFDFGSTTTDESIKQMARLQIENFIIYRYRDTDRHLSDTFFLHKTDMELKYMLISERDLIRSSDPKFQNRVDTNAPSPPDTMPKGLHGKRQNLNGWNIGAALSKNNSNIHSIVFHPTNKDSENPNFVAMSKNYFFIRASISTVGNGTHVPTIVRRFVKALRNSDPTMQIQPFDTDDTDLNHILDTESLLPDDPTDILTWVRGITSTPKRIKFSLRASNTCLLRDLRTDIFGWCKTNKCWIDMDYIESEKLFACG